ncbi:putative ectonucleotide pyrophosphatase/phosphodiesterase [Triangularia verruculosa]|uniref:Ectonucleotide pyrophosphatase/phosphodiesterase n=1 Tax=Triangularia verruculosa TaxID=2587418 RepID=A0AAN7AVH8_9PEZI|nr:putative ectonucleotide pyrophosphatase/phosphodiesterase [Triangularia verruculosa]
MRPLQPLNTTNAGGRDQQMFLSPSDYDADAISIRSDQDTDSEDDERQMRARNSRELRAHDRLVLMEEEELGQLVTETRRQKERERRGSGLPLPIPNPLTLFSRRLSDASRSRSASPSFHSAESVDGHQGEEKRSRRKARRKAKKDRLLAEAQHGEDGELMYEMEEGGMKSGSETGESSDRDDSDEVDRNNLLHMGAAKAKRRRNCCRWGLLYALIIVGFGILVLVAWKLSIEKKASAHHAAALVSNGTAMFAPTTIIISLDGFRADFVDRGLTPRLNAFIKEGVSPRYMLPSFPTVTFPNHYTLVTGLYPEAHGVVGNSFWDPELKQEFYYTDPKRSLDPKWWKGEPFWVTAQKQGLKTAIHMWPGSEAHVLNTDPTYMDKYNGKEKLSKKVDRVLEFIDMPDDERPQVIAAYVPNVDAVGHTFGPNSTEIQATIGKVDKMLDQIFRGLEERRLTNIVNVIVVSDHGMATTDITRIVQLEDLVDINKIEHTDGWPLVGLRPKNPNDLQEIHAQLVEKTKANPNLDVYLRDVDMPERWHFSRNDRIAPLWIVPKTGWALVKMEEMDLKEAQAKGTVYSPRGLHGYDNEHPLMRALFIARGPAFPHQPNSEVEVFQNINVYNMLCDSVGITPAPNNGTLRLPLKPIGLHSDHGPTRPPVLSISTSAKLAITDPVTTSPISVATTATVTKTVEKTVEVNRPTPQPSANPSGDGEDDGDKSTLDKVGDSVKGFWDWFSGKVSHWWDKVSNGGDGDSDEPPENPNE